MRQQIVAGNWKMNKTFAEADQLLYDLAIALEKEPTEKVKVIVCPPMPYLEMATDVGLENKFEIGAQNCAAFDNGAYTGEVSAEILASFEVKYCIVGHSERRKYFKETSQDLSQKVNKLLEHKVQPIFCCGEQLEERDNNTHFDVVKAQIEEALFHLTEQQIQEVVIAYEPVWAIGTGKTASNEQAQEMHAFIREQLAAKYGKAVADNISLLYGGSCNPKNAKGLFAQKDIDGGLIGGASLKADDFTKIIHSF